MVIVGTVGTNPSIQYILADYQRVLVRSHIYIMNTDTLVIVP